MRKSRFALYAGIIVIFLNLQAVVGSDDDEMDYDVVIYGGTSAGVAAAVQAARMEKSVLLIEPGNHLGGLSSGGLGMTDIGNKNVIGGLAREFYQRVYQYYSQSEIWVQQSSNDYKERKNDWDEENLWWRFEPHVAELIFRNMVDETSVKVIFNERLDLADGVVKNRSLIKTIRMESGKIINGKIFIDATYEGDLMAKAGVSYTVGREGTDIYGESLNGVQTKNAKYHQFVVGVDPYIKKGDPKSGLLPGIDPLGPGEEGSGDLRVQAYCFRMCLTDVADNQVPFKKPAGYDPLQYELLFRNFEAGANVVPWNNSAMPNRKTDTNNNRGFSTDHIGQNYDWPDGDYETREKIFNEHLKYQQGLMWTLANHPRVPDSIRAIVSKWGLAADEFAESGNWSHQIYVREARRMISSYVMTEKNCRGEIVAANPVGMAAYTMDSHNVQRYVDKNGYVKNEGDVQVGGFSPYPISYQSIIPNFEECANLLVPVCLSASHIAYGSIRMEPVFMVLGQSAAIAGCLAIDQNKAVQYVDYASLQKTLLTTGQILELPDKLSDSHFITEWWLIGPFDNPENKGLMTVYPPESEFDTTKSYWGRDDTPVSWHKHIGHESGYVSLMKILSTSEIGVAYAYRVLEVPGDTLLKIGVGSNDGVRLWVNGKLYLDRLEARRAVPNQDVLSIPFRRGINTILLKVDQVGGEWGFYFSIIDEKKGNH